MKFTKQEAVESITAKFADKAKGIDLARTIGEAVSNGIEMIGEESEMELDAFTAIVEKNVSSALGLARHLKTTTSTELQQQLDELKKKLEGKDTPPAPPKTNEIKSEDPAIQALLDKMTKMEEKLQRQERDTTIEGKRAALKAKMSEDIKDNEWIDAYLKEINVTEDMDVEAKAKDYVAFYNKTSAGGGKRSVTPKPTGGNDDQIDSYVKSTVEAAARLKKQMSSPVSGISIKTETK